MFSNVGGKNRFNKCKLLYYYDDKNLFGLGSKGLGAKCKEAAKSAKETMQALFSLNLHFPLARGKWSDYGKILRKSGAHNAIVMAVKDYFPIFTASSASFLVRS